MLYTKTISIKNRYAIFALSLVLFCISCTPIPAHAATNDTFKNLWCTVTAFFNHPCTYVSEYVDSAPVSPVKVAVSSSEITPPPPPPPSITATTSDREPLVTNNITNVYTTNKTYPVAVVYKPAPVTVTASKPDIAVSEEDRYVGFTLFRKQTESLADNMIESVSSLGSDLGDSFETKSLTVTGAFYDNGGSKGSVGYVLQSTGNGFLWVATSTLGFGVSNFSITEIDTSAELSSILSDETGTGNMVFSNTPTFSGTVNAAAAILSSSLTMSGSAANIILNTNYLSGDGDDEGIFVDDSGNVGLGTSTPTQSLTVQGNIHVTGAIFDSANYAGINGMVLQTNGSGFNWVATSTLGIGEGALTAADIDTSAKLLSILTDQTGTGKVVFSASPTLTGTIQAAAMTLSSSLTMSGSVANIILGTNYLSGDGGDEGIYIDALGKVGIGTTTPSKRLTILETVADAQVSIAYDASRFALIQVDSVGDLYLSSTGGDTTWNDENVWVCAGGACPSVSASSTGNVIVENGYYLGNGFRIDGVLGTTTQIGIFNTSNASVTPIIIFE